MSVCRIISCENGPRNMFVVFKQEVHRSAVCCCVIAFEIDESIDIIFRGGLHYQLKDSRNVLSAISQSWRSK